MSISPLRRAAAAVAAVAAAAAFVGSPASAQAPNYPPTTGPTTTSTTTSVSGLTLLVVCSSDTIIRGRTIPATVTGFDPGTTGIFTIASVEQQIGTYTVSAARVGTASVTIPANISVGAHTIFARGILNGRSASVSRAVNVLADTTGGVGCDRPGGGGGGGGGGGKLVRTGAVVVPTALVGLGLVAGGAALKRASRRGRSSTTV